MGLGNNSRKYTFVTLRVVSGEGENKVTDPAFVVKVKNGAGDYVPGEDFKYIEGELVDIKKDSYTHDGRTIHKVSLFLYDKSEDMVYKVDCGYNGLTRSILNSLMSIPDFRDIQILVYKKTDKETNKTYPGAVVRFNFHVDPQKSDWFIDNDEIKSKMVEITIRGQKEWDTFPADEFVVNMALEVIVPKLRTVEEAAMGVAASSHSNNEPPAGDLGGGSSMVDDVRNDQAGRLAGADTPDTEGDDLPF